MAEAWQIILNTGLILAVILAWARLNAIKDKLWVITIHLDELHRRTAHLGRSGLSEPGEDETSDRQR